MACKKKKILTKFRDVSPILQVFRDILLGRAYNLQNRFAPLIAPRTVPKPDIPRGPCYKISNNYYHKRGSYDSVWPPVVAPIAEGPSIGQDVKTRGSAPGGLNPNEVCFVSPPTPGIPWWWDGHCYFESVLEAKPPQGAPPLPKAVCPPPQRNVCPCPPLDPPCPPCNPCCPPPKSPCP